MVFKQGLVLEAANDLSSLLFPTKTSVLRRTMPHTSSKGSRRYSTPASRRVLFHSSLVLVGVPAYVPFSMFLPAQGEPIFSPHATNLTDGRSRAVSMYSGISLPSLLLKELHDKTFLRRCGGILPNSYLHGNELSAHPCPFPRPVHVLC